jgi:solute carrier family 66 (lysosomal lysine-arginine transporter), member 1
MIFLGVWALFGVGTLTGSRRGLPSENAIRVGHILTGGSATTPVQHTPLSPKVAAPDTSMKSSPYSVPIELDDISLSYDDLYFADPYHSDDSDDQHDGTSTEYLIGRISAWICTTLYLTSRLPQIWKNVCILLYPA